MNRINPVWQCLGTLFVPTGLYCFKRINKLRMGIVIYSVSLGFNIIGGFIEASSILNWDINVLLASSIALLFYALSIVLPMVIIKRWTDQYNSKPKIVS